MEYPPFDTLLAEDSASLPPNHSDERINYDGSFLIPTISKFQTTLYNAAAKLGRGNSNFNPKLPKNDDDVLAERALVNGRRLATTRRERAHAWYVLSRRRENLKRQLRELQTDHAIKTNREPSFCNAKNLFKYHVSSMKRMKFWLRTTRNEIRSTTILTTFSKILIQYWIWFLMAGKTLELCGPGHATKFRCFNVTRSCLEIYKKKNLSSRRYRY